MSELGKVYLVGAGPGDPELLTLKGARLLRNADALIYDRLVGPEVLELVPESCEKIYVGKESGWHVLPQEEINQLLVESAKKYKQVVRLKGGDPFVFGRGGEEIEVLHQHGIEYEVVPGISSGFGGAAYSGIPVTHRGVSSSVALITGHKAFKDDLNWEAFAGIDTLIFVMAIRSRQKNAAALIKAGRPANDPVAFIENATTAHHNVIITTLDEVANRPPAVNLPAVMIVGKVVDFHKTLNWFSPDEWNSDGFRSNISELQNNTEAPK